MTAVPVTLGNDRLIRAQHALAETEAAMAADQPVIARAEQINAELSDTARVDRWAEAVRTAWRVRGVA